jgi:hypothetical protein
MRETMMCKDATGCPFIKEGEIYEVDSDIKRNTALIFIEGVGLYSYRLSRFVKAEEIYNEKTLSSL